MEKDKSTGRYKAVLIGGSAGALAPLLQILQKLPANFPLPVIIVLHRLNNNDDTLEHVLAHKTKLKVKEVEDKEAILPGHAYLAPADYHLLIEKNHRLSLDVSEKVLFSRPSIDVTFESAVHAYEAGVIGIVLSGANADGSEGLRAIKNAGGITIVQRPEEAEIRVMPDAAILTTKGVHYIESAHNMANRIMDLVNAG